MKAGNSRIGFSLIELMVVIAIIGLIAGVVVASFSGGIKVWESASMLTRVEQDVYFSAENIRRDVANTFQFHDLEFRGEKDYVSFPGLISVTDEEGETGIHIGTVKYLRNRSDGSLVRLAWPYPDIEENADIEFIAGGIQAVSFGYLKPGADRSSDWAESWQSQSNFPAAFRMDISFTNRGQSLVLSREIPLTEGLWRD